MFKRLMTLVATLSVAAGMALAAPSSAMALGTRSTPKPPAPDVTVSYVTSSPEMIALFSSPAAQELTAAERESLAQRLYEVGTALRQNAPVSSGAIDTPEMSIGLGWYIYLHNVTPSDQRFLINAGVGSVAAVICAASAGTACAIAGVAAAVIISAVSEYYKPRCNLEVQLYWTGQLRKIYASRCW